MKTRIWYCSCCHLNYRRYKNDDQTKRRVCQKCNIELKAGRKQIYWKDCKHNRIRKNILKFEENYYSKVRNAGGRILKPSFETKQLWKLVDKAKQKPAFIKRANVWLVCLEKDIHNTSEKDWARTINEQGEIQRSREGSASIPKIELQNKDTYEYGHYKRVFMEGIHEIILTNKGLFDMKETLLHEILHYIDHKANISQTHDDYFEIRLERIKKMFKIKSDLK